MDRHLRNHLDGPPFEEPTPLQIFNEYLHPYQFGDMPGLHPRNLIPVLNVPPRSNYNRHRHRQRQSQRPAVVQQQCAPPRREGTQDVRAVTLFRNSKPSTPAKSGHKQSSSAGEAIAGSSKSFKSSIEDTFHGSFEPESISKYPFTAEEGAEDEKILGEIDLGENWPKIAEFMNEDGSIDTKGFWEAAPKDELERVIDSALGFVKSDFGRRFNFVLPSKKEFFEKSAGKKEDKLGHGLAINPIADSSASTSNATMVPVPNKREYNGNSKQNASGQKGKANCNKMQNRPHGERVYTNTEIKKKREGKGNPRGGEASSSGKTGESDMENLAPVVVTCKKGHIYDFFGFGFGKCPHCKLQLK